MLPARAVKISGFTCTSRDGLAWLYTSFHDQHGMAAQTSLGMRRAVIPLCACLSPPALLQCHAGQFGLELQLLPSARAVGFFPFGRLARGWFAGRFWSLAMVASLAYPLRPVAAALGIVYLVGVAQFCATDIGRSMRQFAHRGLAFVAPVPGFAAFLRDPSILYRELFAVAVEP